MKKYITVVLAALLVPTCVFAQNLDFAQKKIKEIKAQSEEKATTISREFIKNRFLDLANESEVDRPFALHIYWTMVAYPEADWAQIAADYTDKKQALLDQSLLRTFCSERTLPVYKKHFAKFLDDKKVYSYGWRYMTAEDFKKHVAAGRTIFDYYFSLTFYDNKWFHEDDKVINGLIMAYDMGGGKYMAFGKIGDDYYVHEYRIKDSEFEGNKLYKSGKYPKYLISENKRFNDSELKKELAKVTNVK
ncbi:hypothetical protein Dip510_000141 [Elusimicrobium posterum]|uniref:hypothetical protein n=1 Tax=Elusimicrobium posterum TaxID=3116653 RepID=UPI003C777B35